MSGGRHGDATPRPEPAARPLFEGKARDLEAVEDILRPGKAYAKGKSEPPWPWSVCHIYQSGPRWSMRGTPAPPPERPQKRPPCRGPVEEAGVGVSPYRSRPPPASRDTRGTFCTQTTARVSPLRKTAYARGWGRQGRPARSCRPVQGRSCPCMRGTPDRIERPRFCL